MTPSTRNLFVTVAAATCLTWPMATLADPPDDHGGRGAQDSAQQPAPDKGHGGEDKGQKPAQGQGKVAAAHVAAVSQAPVTAHVVSGSPASAQAPMALHQAGLVGQADHRARVMNPPIQGAPATGQGVAAASGRGQQGRRALVVNPAPVQPAQASANQRQAFVRQSARPAKVQVLAGWSRPAAGPAQAQAGQQWRSAHTGWDSGARWRGDSNWWRGDAGFRLFRGVRVGFFFIPELGYVSAPAEYRDRHWNAGDQLPNWYWRYQVRDFWNYGLPQPPDGCAWVWVGNDVALIDASDGYILDIDHNAW